MYSCGMKTILIPTDFEASSIQRTQDLLKSLKNESVKIIFFHAFKLTDSISDLLMLSRRSTDYAQIPEEFHRALFQLKQAFSETLDGIAIEYFYGSTMAAFRNFAEANNIDCIFFTEQYSFNKISKYSIDPMLFLEKSGIPFIRIKPVTVIQQNLEPDLCY